MDIKHTLYTILIGIAITAQTAHAMQSHLAKLPADLKRFIAHQVIAQATSQEDAIKKIKSFFSINQQFLALLNENNIGDIIVAATEPWGHDYWRLEQLLSIKEPGVEPLAHKKINQLAHTWMTEHDKAFNALIKNYDLLVVKKAIREKKIPAKYLALLVFANPGTPAEQERKLDLLIEAGAHPEMIASVKRFRELVDAIGYHNTALAQELIKKYPELVNEYGTCYSTPLIKAASANNLPLVQQLLHAGANVNAMQTLGPTALAYSVSANNLAMTRELIAAGAQVKGYIGDEFWGDPVIQAIRNNNAEMLRVLLAAGADKHKRFENDQTAYNYAWEEGNPEIIEILEEE